ncbi:uncharacterized protein PHALS_09897 [Plasmopara halstedii]|uniref:Nucleolar protein 11 C-terminal domain-containing protein n=1 Tax=Plasmopara halstedii TaxID=4781 RepID=A0A0N7L4U6_PLAHL|nr:uncharacterized protein PHALS_09897 [Plasmopara halstedii]CEG39659.1 hypothetical protein PHALS_09897 [Plasmopara halstedii]|eukprot:XP_024576028.1 hypothetical protein PHALS_09897 [Plasmopara halstedii]
MELDQAISLWRGRPADAALLGATSSLSKESDRLVLLTSTEDVREISASTRKCINHWTFRAGSAHALSVAATRHPQLRVFFGVCGAPGISASKKARQVRRQETNKTTALPVNEGLAMWHETDRDVTKWQRTPLQSKSKVFSLLVHSKLKEDIVLVFQDGSFVTYDKDMKKGFHSDDVKDATSVEEEDKDDDDEFEETVVWADLETGNLSSVKGTLFLSILMQKANGQSDKRLELLIYQIVIPYDFKRLGETLRAVLLVRHRVNLPDNEELSACAFHAETFSYSMIGRFGCWQTLRFVRDALTESLTLVATQNMPDLVSATHEASVPVHKKRKLQTISPSVSGYFVSRVGNYTYLVSTSLENPLEFTGWDSKFAVPVSKVEVNLVKDNERENEVVVGRSSKDGIGKLVQLVSVGAGDAVLAVYERSVFLIHVRNKHSTLASVIGATASNASVGSEIASMPDTNIQWENVKATNSVNNDTLDAKTWKMNFCSEDDRESQLLADLSDPQVTRTAADFTHRLDEALNKEKKRMGGKEGEYVSYRLLQTVTRRCLNSTELALWQPLETMLRTNRLSSRTEPTLLPTLMKHNQFSLLECAIVHLVDIDERSIVRLIKYIIHKSSNSTFINYVTKKTQTQNKLAGRLDSIAVCERFVIALLGLPTSSVFLHRAIRELDVEEVLLVLAICKKLLLALTIVDEADSKDKLTEASEKVESSKNEIMAILKEERRFTPLPSASKCCAWICALLDAHFSNLVQRSSQNARVARTIHQLNKLVQMQLDASAQYESVYGVLSNFLSGVRLPRAPGLPDYVIEELCL